jgi:ATP-dependent Clp protease ATP-binding subunit ClpB
VSFGFNRLSLASQELVLKAQHLANDLSNPEIEPLHLLASLLSDQRQLAVSILQKINVNTNKLTEMLSVEIKKLPRVIGGKQPQVSSSLQKVFESSFTSSSKINDDFVTVEHLLFGLASSDSKAKKLLGGK